MKHIQNYKEFQVFEGHFSNIDIIAQEAEDFDDFVMRFKEEYPDTKIDEDMIDYLGELYDGRSIDESMDEINLDELIGSTLYKCEYVSKSGSVTLYTSKGDYSIGCYGGADVELDGDIEIENAKIVGFGMDFTEITVKLENKEEKYIPYKITISDPTGGEGLEVYKK